VLSQAERQARSWALKLRRAPAIILRKADAIIAIRQDSTFRSIQAIAIEAERRRPISFGRLGSPGCSVALIAGGGRRAAATYSLIVTVKMNGVDPQT
jgi:hypothetical protein